MKNYVIIDLEMCKVPPEKYEETTIRNELIQIGAVLLDESLEIYDTFVTYVCPEFGTIDDFIEELTGITNEDTKDAPYIDEAIDDFLDWLPEDAVIVSWSETDRYQIMNELDAKEIYFEELEGYFDTWMDCQKTFSEKMSSNKIYKLSEALIIADIYPEDGEHDALVDARNTAILFAKMMREDKLQLSSYYISDGEKKQTTYSPFADLLEKFNKS